MITVHIDDMAIAGASETIAWAKKAMTAMFPCKDEI